MAARSTTAPRAAQRDIRTIHVGGTSSANRQQRTWNTGYGIRFQETRRLASAAQSSVEAIDGEGSVGSTIPDEHPYNMNDKETQTYISYKPSDPEGRQPDNIEEITSSLRRTSLQSPHASPNAKRRAQYSRQPAERSQDSTQSYEDEAASSDGSYGSSADITEEEYSVLFSSQRSTNLDADEAYVSFDESLVDELDLSAGEESNASDEVAGKEVHIPFDFQIPIDVLEKAQEAEPGSEESFWSHKLYRDKQGNKVEVHYCQNKEESEKVAKLFLQEKALGFDLEWRSIGGSAESIRDSISVIQLASPSRIAIFHIAKFPPADEDEFTIFSLSKIMNNPDIAKCGVSILGDGTRLAKYLGVNSRGLLELSHLHRVVKCCEEGFGAPSKRLVSLAIQTKEHLGLPLDKSLDVRCSDWSKTLEQGQIMYAADDAYAGVHIYNVLEGKRLAFDPAPPRPPFAERMQQFEVIPSQKSKETSTETAVAAVDDRPPQLIAAETWARERQTMTPDERPLKAQPACLRAYALWHHNSMSANDVAAMLRSPPLLQNTVTCYIMEAVRTEGLPYEQERILELISILPEYAVDYRFKDFIARVRGDAEQESV